MKSAHVSQSIVLTLTINYRTRYIVVDVALIRINIENPVESECTDLLRSCVPKI